MTICKNIKSFNHKVIEGISSVWDAAFFQRVNDDSIIFVMGSADPKWVQC